MEEIPTAPDPEQETKSQAAAQMPQQITLMKEQQDRCYPDGCWVVAAS